MTLTQNLLAYLTDRRYSLEEADAILERYKETQAGQVLVGRWQKPVSDFAAPLLRTIHWSLGQFAREATATGVTP